ncbi:MAG TPA: flap structure-specific endonuclease [Thermoplasmata archaeon]|nr:flap structure-specific endonuclease [Thermoplasmata archaeon]
MGLPIRDIVPSEEVGWAELAGKTLAVDAYNAIYQFLATIRQPDGRLFTDGDGRVTSHLMGVFYRTTSLLGDGVRPVWVFDGRPPELKSGTIRGRIAVKERAETEWKEALAVGDLERARRKAAQTSRLTGPMVAEAKEVLSALGVPHVQAPSEGEAQAARMAARGVVWGAASEDYDCLPFGAPRLVRGLAARGNRAKGNLAQLIDRAALLTRLGINDEELIMLGIVVGTDYNEGAAGFGPKKALKLVQQHLGFEATLKAAGLDPAELQPVAELFRNPETSDVAAPLFGPVNDSEVHRLLVEGHGFSPERVQAGVRKARQPATAPPPAAATPPRGRQPMLESFGEGAE